MPKILIYLKRQALPFVVGVAMGSVWTYHRSADPNKGWDPQAETGFCCHREELRRVPGGVHSWSATAYDVNCGFIGNYSIIYAYLLKPGQVISQSTLVVSYQGSDPELEWVNAETLLVRTGRIADIWKKVVAVGDVTVHYDFPPGF